MIREHNYVYTLSIMSYNKPCIYLRYLQLAIVVEVVESYNMLRSRRDMCQC